MGGPHATLLPREVAEFADIVVAGEAETVWPLVLRDVERETTYAVGRHVVDEATGANVEVLPNGAKIYRCPQPAGQVRMARMTSVLRSSGSQCPAGIDVTVRSAQAARIGSP